MIRLLRAYIEYLGRIGMEGDVQQHNPGVEDDKTLVVIPRPAGIDELEVALRRGTRSCWTCTHYSERRNCKSGMMGRTSRSWRNLEEAAVVFILTCTDPIACEPNALGGHVSPGIPHTHQFPAQPPRLLAGPIGQLTRIWGTVELLTGTADSCINKAGGTIVPGVSSHLPNILRKR